MGLDPAECEVTVRDPVGGERRGQSGERQPAVDPGRGAE